MKKIILFLLFITTFAFSQRESIFDGEMENGGFGALNLKITSVKKQTGVFVGGYGGWLINHRLLIGVGGYGLVNNVPADKSVVSIYNFVREPLLTFGYGGAVLEYYIEPNSVVHSSVSALIGGGGVLYRQGGAGEYFNASWGDPYKTGTNTVFVFEPGVSVEVNMTNYMKIGFGVSYRFVNGVDLPALKNSDLSNISGGISLKFGKF
jgi:hypothetical protein